MANNSPLANMVGALSGLVTGTVGGGVESQYTAHQMSPKKSAEGIDSGLVLSYLQARGMPVEWLNAMAKVIALSGNGPFQDMDTIRMLVTTTMPRTAAQTMAVDCVMETLKGMPTGSGKYAFETTKTLTPILDAAAVGATVVSLDEVAAKIGHDGLPALNKLLDDAAFGGNSYELVITVRDGATVVSVNKKSTSPGAGSH